MKNNIYIIICTIILNVSCIGKNQYKSLERDKIVENNETIQNKSKITLNSNNNLVIIYDSLKKLENYEDIIFTPKRISIDKSDLSYVTFDYINDVLIDSRDETKVQDDKILVDTSSLDISNLVFRFNSNNDYPIIESTIEELKFHDLSSKTQFLNKLIKAKEDNLLFYHGKLELWFLSKDSSILMLYPMNGASLDVTKKLFKRVEEVLTPSPSID